jgi:putative mRNA 3-end processing factor
MATDLIVQRPEGLYCPAGDFYIDPWRAVPRAVITHAHADHARSGHGHYLAHHSAEGVMLQRLGAITLQKVQYGEVVEHHGVRISLPKCG